MLLIIKTGSTLPPIKSCRGDFEDWFVAGVRSCSAGRTAQIEIVDVSQGGRLPQLDNLRGIIITGSPAMVSHRADWSEQTACWLASAVEADCCVLGVCYGHQLLAHALGGLVQRNPRGYELGTVELWLDESAKADPLFRVLPPMLLVHEAHEECVSRLPDGAVLLASSARDPHQAFRVGERVWGVQFHPEFDVDVMCRYIVHREQRLREQGQSPELLLKVTRESARIPLELKPVSAKNHCEIDDFSPLPAEKSEHGRLVLQRFVELCYLKQPS